MHVQRKKIKNLCLLNNHHHLIDTDENRVANKFFALHFLQVFLLFSGLVWILNLLRLEKKITLYWLLHISQNPVYLIGFSIGNITSLGAQFLLKLFFDNFNFWNTLFYKIMPNFRRTVTHCIHKTQQSPFSILIFGEILVVLVCPKFLICYVHVK